MVKRVIALLITAIIIFIPFLSFADISDDMMNSTSQKVDRMRGEGDKAVEKSSKTSEERVDTTFDNIESGSSSVNQENAKKTIAAISSGTNSLTWYILGWVQKLSSPVALIGIIIGALITNVLGPRNMVRKKLGITLMYGFLSFWVIAQVVPVLFMLLLI